MKLNDEIFVKNKFFLNKIIRNRFIFYYDFSKSSINMYSCNIYSCICNIV